MHHAGTGLAAEQTACAGRPIRYAGSLKPWRSRAIRQDHCGKADKAPADNIPKGSRTISARHIWRLRRLETNTPEQEEAFCRKALEFGASQAYMGLYFISCSEERGAGARLSQGIHQDKTADSVPYVILGESELEKKNYQLADTYLREAKKISRASSPRVAWMLFQANYLLGNYQLCRRDVRSSAQERKVRQGAEDRLSTDARVSGHRQAARIQKYQPQLAAADNTSTFCNFARSPPLSVFPFIPDQTL